MGPENKEQRFAPESQQPVDVAKLLSQWYLPISTYAHEARRLDQQTVEVRYLVPGFHCDPELQPPLVGNITATKTEEGGKNLTVVTNQLVVDRDPVRKHTEGHFRVETDISLLPAYMADGMQMQAARHINPRYWLSGFRTIGHFEPGLPAEIAQAQLIMDADSQKARGVVTVGERVHTRGFDMQFEEGPEIPDKEWVLAQHKFFEIAAQMGGSAMFLFVPEALGDNKQVVYSSIGRSTLPLIPVFPGDELIGNVTLRRSTEFSTAVDVQIRRHQDEIWQFGNLALSFLQADMLKGKIDQLRQSS